MSLKILHLVDSLAPSSALAQLQQLMPRLSQAGCDARLYALHAPGAPAERLPGPTRLLSRRRTFDLVAVADLKLEADRFRPDVVHSWHPTAQRVAELVSNLNGAQRLVESHRAGFARGGFWQWIRSRVQTTLWHALIVDCNDLAAAAVAAGWPAEQVHVLRPAAPISERPADSHQALRSELGLPGDARLIGAVGSLRLQQRWHDLIWSADLLKVVRDDVHLLIVGDGPHRQRLDRFRRRVEIADKVHFLGARYDLARVLAQCDLLWVGSATSGLATGVAEAMAAGVPVVAVDAPAQREAVAHGQTGFLVRVGDRAGLARAAQRILTQPDLARSLGDEARRRARELFAPDDVAAGYLNLYRRLAAH